MNNICISHEAAFFVLKQGSSSFAAGGAEESGDGSAQAADEHTLRVCAAQFQMGHGPGIGDLCSKEHFHVLEFLNNSRATVA